MIADLDSVRTTGIFAGPSAFPARRALSLCEPRLPDCGWNSRIPSVQCPPWFNLSIPGQTKTAIPLIPGREIPLPLQPLVEKHTVLYAGDDFVLRLYIRDLSSPSSAHSVSALATDLPDDLDDAARQRLVLENLPKVIRMAFDYRGLGLPLNDLINEGNMGLMRAAELFDPARKVRFAHYAKAWIRVHMQRALSYQAWPVSFPADFSWRRGQVRKAEESLSAKLHRNPESAEVADACGLKLPTVERLRATPTPSFIPFDTPCPNSEAELTLTEVIPDETIPRPDQEAARRSDLEFVAGLLATLTPCEQQVIRLRFGLDDGCERTLDEIGQMLGYVRQGIHRIQSAALAKLRQHARFLERCSALHPAPI